MNIFEKDSFQDKFIFQDLGIISKQVLQLSERRKIVKERESTKLIVLNLHNTVLIT